MLASSLLYLILSMRHRLSCPAVDCAGGAIQRRARRKPDRSKLMVLLVCVRPQLKSARKAWLALVSLADLPLPHTFQTCTLAAEYRQIVQTPSVARLSLPSLGRDHNAMAKFSNASEFRTREVRRYNLNLIRGTFNRHCSMCTCHNVYIWRRIALHASEFQSPIECLQ